MKKSLLTPQIIAKLKCDAEIEDKKNGNKNDLSVLQKGNVVKNTAQSAHVQTKKVDSSKSSFRRSEISLDLLKELITADRTFEITGLEAEGAMSNMIAQLEAVMKHLNKECRVYTVGRSAAVAAAAIPTGVTQVTGALAALGIGLHNFATYNPDYEIGKHLLDKKLSVKKQTVTMENGKRKSRLSLLGDIVEAAAGCVADAMLENAKENAKRTGREAEFKEKEKEFNKARAGIRGEFRKLQGKK